MTSLIFEKILSPFAYLKIVLQNEAFFLIFFSVKLLPYLVSNFADTVGTICFPYSATSRVNVADFEIGNTKRITNQLGYIKHNENRGFNDKAIISI